ncbi:MAG TPA: aconitase X catalytic domain-containing protein [Hyphomicrobiaceae bacterium]|nr:aconitase X catalytic domain-containing protein [Hyphomicrobiaceae bacterium]
MHLDEEERAMLAGARGPARQWAMQHQLAVGSFFDAADFVRVGQAHIMADTESLGASGVAWLEALAALPREQCRVSIPTITDPRGLDFACYKRLQQTDAMADLEARTIRAFEALGVLMTNTCINYQTILPPVRGEHMAFGDTGVVIYCNSVMGARSNFEGGPSALAAGLTGRTPRYGYHLDVHRAGTKHFAVRHRPRDLADWGALGGIVGRATNSYWEVPVVTGLDTQPNSDELKHFGAALASFGSVALYHIPGVTPEAASLTSAFAGRSRPAALTIEAQDVAAFYAGYAAQGDKVDVVVFAAPQLSLLEIGRVAGLIAGRRINVDTTLIVATSPEIKFAADRMGLTQSIEDAGGIVTSGVCFYQSYAREMAEANGWQRLLTNSAKLVNIIGGYGYQPTLASMEQCIDSAVAGRIV